MVPQFPDPGQGKRVAFSASAELEVEGMGKFVLGQVATIGRSAESHVVLNLRSVSRHHARIFFEGGHYWIKDLGSANGTSVNGKKVTLQMLANQDSIRFGDAAAVFRSQASSSGPARLARDPLAGSDLRVPDGTPTGGLDGAFPAPGGLPGKQTASHVEPATLAGGVAIQALTQKIEQLKAENQHLRHEIQQHRSATATGTSAEIAENPDQKEIARLRGLVAQLERALADTSLRLRNLQQHLDCKNQT